MEVGESFKISTNNKKDAQKVSDAFDTFFNTFTDEDGDMYEEDDDTYRNLLKQKKEGDLYISELEEPDGTIFLGEELPDSNIEAFFAFIIDLIKNNVELQFEARHAFRYSGNGVREVYYYKFDGKKLIHKAWGGVSEVFAEEGDVITEGIVNAKLYREKEYPVENGEVLLGDEKRPKKEVGFAW